MRVMRWPIALLAVLMLAACSSSGGTGYGNALVMQRPAGTVLMSGNPAGTITQVQVPVVFNRSGARVRVLSVQLTNPPRGIRILETDAYHTWHVPVGIMAPTIESTGALEPGQPRFWGSRHPVTAITLPAHGRAAWVAVIAFTAPPGSFHFTGVRITYTTGGVNLWQAEALSYYIRYSAPRVTPDHQS